MTPGLGAILTCGPVIGIVADWGNIRRSTKTAHQRLIAARTNPPRCPAKSSPPDRQSDQDVRLRCRNPSKVDSYLR